MLAVALVLAACSGEPSAESRPPSTTSPPATVPDDVGPGEGVLVLGGQATLLTVRACSLEPATDPATGIVTELTLDADDATGTEVAVTRSSFVGDLPTVTETVVVASSDGAALLAERFDRGGTLIDLRAAGAVAPLIEVDGTLVRAAGVFGPPDTADGDVDLVEGELVARCP